LRGDLKIEKRGEGSNKSTPGLEPGKPKGGLSWGESARGWVKKRKVIEKDRSAPGTLPTDSGVRDEGKLVGAPLGGRKKGLQSR